MESSCGHLPLQRGGTLDPNCYRPISILPCLSKVFDSQVNKQITAHFESHHTFSAMQSGFRAGHGFSNDCLAWFTNYFSDRVQCVKSEDLLSGPLEVSMGAPQGSILGRTLFSVDINDVALAAGESLIHLYADDPILYTSGPSVDTVLTTLQTSFNAIQLSSHGLQLLLNTSKTKCMLFNLSMPAPARPPVQHHYSGRF